MGHFRSSDDMGLVSQFQAHSRDRCQSSERFEWSIALNGLLEHSFGHEFNL